MRVTWTEGTCSHRRVSSNDDGFLLSNYYFQNAHHLFTVLLFKCHHVHFIFSCRHWQLTSWSRAVINKNTRGIWGHKCGCEFRLAEFDHKSLLVFALNENIMVSYKQRHKERQRLQCNSVNRKISHGWQISSHSIIISPELWWSFVTAHKIITLLLVKMFTSTNYSAMYSVIAVRQIICTHTATPALWICEGTS